MTSSEDSSPTNSFAFAPPALPPGNSSFIPSTDYKPNPMKTASFSSTRGMSPPMGSFTPAASTIGNQSYFPESLPSAYGLGSASSFSSASGSAAGGSFSSVDNLPGISKEFVRPSLNATRRPATAGGALQSQSPFAGYLMNGNGHPSGQMQRNGHPSPDDRNPDDQGEERDDMFDNSFEHPSEDDEEDQGVSPETISAGDENSHALSSHRRASAPHYNIPGSTWGSFPPTSSHDAASSSSLGLPSAPLHMGQHDMIQQQSSPYGLPQFPRSNYSGRPQTSDGLPSYNHLHGAVTLPSAQSIARQIPGLANTGAFFQHSPGTRSSLDDQRQMGMPPPPTSFPGDRAYTFDHLRLMNTSSLPGSGRPAYVPPTPLVPGRVSEGGASLVPSEQLGYMNLSGSESGAGPAQRKRPRRRYEEIERLYPCGWNGCEKSYGTLNHLNAHVMMQKHGEKRLPSEFKEMRKSWRKKKRESAAAHANAQYAVSAAAWQANQQRYSIASSASSEPDWDRRESGASMMSIGTDPRSSLSYTPTGGYGWGNTPVQPTMVGMESRPSTAGSSISSMSMDGRFMPTPTSATLPSAPYTFLNGPPAHAGSVAARRPSAPQHLPIPPHNPMAGFRQTEGDHLTPTAGNPFPSAHQQQGGTTAVGTGQVEGKPLGFSMLTSPIGGGGMGLGRATEFEGQFAFQR